MKALTGECSVTSVSVLGQNWNPAPEGTWQKPWPQAAMLS